MMQQNRGYHMNQKQLLNWIDQVSFVLDDTQLYLDTHPYDQEALSYFNHFQRLRKESMAEYARQYGPLTIDSIDSCQDKWEWVYGKWPWEGGNC